MSVAPGELAVLGDFVLSGSTGIKSTALDGTYVQFKLLQTNPPGGTNNPFTVVAEFGPGYLELALQGAPPNQEVVSVSTMSLHFNKSTDQRHIVQGDTTYAYMPNTKDNLPGGVGVSIGVSAPNTPLPSGALGGLALLGGLAGLGVVRRSLGLS
jgi:hypothetical protein